MKKVLGIEKLLLTNADECYMILLFFLHNFETKKETRIW